MFQAGYCRGPRCGLQWTQLQSTHSSKTEIGKLNGQVDVSDRVCLASGSSGVGDAAGAHHHEITVKKFLRRAGPERLSPEIRYIYDDELVEDAARNMTQLQVRRLNAARVQFALSQE